MTAVTFLMFFYLRAKIYQFNPNIPYFHNIWLGNLLFEVKRLIFILWGQHQPRGAYKRLANEAANCLKRLLTRWDTDDLSLQPLHPLRDRRRALCVCVDRVWHFRREISDLAAAPWAATRQVWDAVDIDGSGKGPGGGGPVSADLSGLHSSPLGRQQRYSCSFVEVCT